MAFRQVLQSPDKRVVLRFSQSGPKRAASASSGMSKTHVARAMVQEERHRSPDGVLALCVRRESDDIVIGFDGGSWHTHGDVLATVEPGLSSESAARRFVEDVLNNRAIIVVLRAKGVVRDIWVTDDIRKELRYRQPGEIMDFRYWDGSTASPPIGE